MKGMVPLYCPPLHGPSRWSGQSDFWINIPGSSFIPEDLKDLELILEESPLQDSPS